MNYPKPLLTLSEYILKIEHDEKHLEDYSPKDFRKIPLNTGEAYLDILNYVKFLNKPIEANMFVAMGPDGAPIKEPSGYQIWLAKQDAELGKNLPVRSADVGFDFYLRRLLFEDFIYIKRGKLERVVHAKNGLIAFEALPRNEGGAYIWINKLEAKNIEEAIIELRKHDSV